MPFTKSTLCFLIPWNLNMTAEKQIHFHKPRWLFPLFPPTALSILLGTYSPVFNWVIFHIFLVFLCVLSAFLFIFTPHFIPEFIFNIFDTLSYSSLISLILWSLCCLFFQLGDLPLLQFQRYTKSFFSSGFYDKVI